MTAPVFTGADGRDAAPVAFSCKAGEPQPGNNGAPAIMERFWDAIETALFVALVVVMTPAAWVANAITGRRY